MGAIREIGSEPSKNSVRYTKRITKTSQKNGVVNSIKGSRQSSGDRRETLSSSRAERRSLMILRKAVSVL